MVGQGEDALLGADTHYAGANAEFDFYLQVPMVWTLQGQDSAENSGFVRYNCFPASEDKEKSGNAGYLEIQYENGVDIMTNKALEDVLTEYEPNGAPKRSFYVEGVVTDQLSGYEARVLRGGLVTEYTPAEMPTVTPTLKPYVAAVRTRDAKAKKGPPTPKPEPTLLPDTNFGVHVARFYCEASDRTYTIIAAATTDDLLSEIWSVMSGFDAYPEG